MFSVDEKLKIKEQLVSCLLPNNEIQRIVIFGSFLDSETPEDLDVAIFQDSQSPYLTLALKYRRLTRAVSEIIPIDIIPLNANVTDDPFLASISKGETVYER